MKSFEPLNRQCASAGGKREERIRYKWLIHLLAQESPTEVFFVDLTCLALLILGRFWTK